MPKITLELTLAEARALSSVAGSGWRDGDARALMPPTRAEAFCRAHRALVRAIVTADRPREEPVDV